MITNKQSDINFINNLANIIFENELKILAEVKHSPEMYSVLLEENIKPIQFNNDEIIISVFNELKEDQQFASETYYILSKEELTEQEKNVITNHILTEGLGRVVKKVIKWLIGRGSDGLGKIVKRNPPVPVFRERGPKGKWRTIDGNTDFTPGVNYYPVFPGRPSPIPRIPKHDTWQGPIPKPLADQFPYPWLRPISTEPPLP